MGRNPLMMSAVRPYAVGSTVKWREGETEYAGIITSVHFDPGGTESAHQGGRAGDKTLEPVYEIAMSDQTLVTRRHRALVLV